MYVGLLVQKERKGSKTLVSSQIWLSGSAVCDILIAGSMIWIVSMLRFILMFHLCYNLIARRSTVDGGERLVGFNREDWIAHYRTNRQRRGDRSCYGRNCTGRYFVHQDEDQARLRSPVCHPIHCQIHGFASVDRFR